MAEPKPQAVVRLDAPFQARVGALLAQLCALFEAGQIEGLYVVWRQAETHELVHQRAALMDGDVSWSAVEMLLRVHCVSRLPGSEG